jgi:hypothetical protein
LAITVAFGHGPPIAFFRLNLETDHRSDRQELPQLRTGSDPKGPCAVSGASMRANRMVIRLALSETRTVSPSPTDRTVAALVGPASRINASKGPGSAFVFIHANHTIRSIRPAEAAVAPTSGR